MAPQDAQTPPLEESFKFAALARQTLDAAPYHAMMCHNAFYRQRGEDV